MTKSVAAEPSKPAQPVFPYPIQQTVLANGLTVLSVAYDSPGTVSYYTIVRTGSRNEVEPGLSGFAHFFEHMMFRGTPKYSGDKYNSLLKKFGADSNAFTTDDWTCYHITASAGALETIVELEADRFQNLSYDEAAFQKEARAVLGEYNKIASSPLLPLEEKLQDLAFNEHTYKHTTIGFLKDIVDMPNQYQYSLKFLERWYRPDNCFVLAVGDVQHGQLVQLAQRHYGSWKRGAAELKAPVEPPQTAERRATLGWKGATLPHLYLGYHVPAFDPHSADIAALDVLSEAVFAKTSPLYRKLVLEEGKVEEIMAGATFHRDPTLLTVLVRVRDVADLPAVEAAIYDALETAAAEQISAARLHDIQSHLRYALVLNSTDAVAVALGNYLQLTGSADALNQIYASYQRVTPADVQRVAGKYFAPTNRTVVTLASEKDLATLGGHTKKSETSTAVQTLQKSPVVSADVASKPALAAEPVTKAAAKPADAKPAVPAAANLTAQPARSTQVALRIAFRTGSQDDPPGKEGLAALTARLVSEGGYGDVSYEQLLEKLYPLAAEIGGDCDKELTVFTGSVHPDNLPAFGKLLTGVLLRPRFAAADFERIRQEHISYLAAGLRGNDDENLGKWTLQLALYPSGHPYGHVDVGTVSGLKSITLDDVRKFYAEHYRAGNLEAGIAGAPAELANALRSELVTGLPKGDAAPARLPEPAKLSDLEVTIVEKPNIATAISIGFPLSINRHDDDFYALAVANSALGEHRTFNGRLMINMRGKRGLNYGDYSYIENFIQDGAGTFPAPNVPRRQQFFSMWIRPVPHDKTLFAIRQAVRELDTLVRDGLTEEEFEATRNFLFHYSKLWVQTPSRRLGYDLDGKFYGRQSLVAELQERLPKLTRDEVNAAIRKHLQARNLAVVVVTENAEKFREALLSGQPSPLVYDTQGTPAEVLAEDKQIAAWPLKVNADRVKIVPVEQLFEK